MRCTSVCRVGAVQLYGSGLRRSEESAHEVGGRASSLERIYLCWIRHVELDALSYPSVHRFNGLRDLQVELRPLQAFVDTCDTGSCYYHCAFRWRKSVSRRQPSNMAVLMHGRRFQDPLTRIEYDIGLLRWVSGVHLLQSIDCPRCHRRCEPPSGRSRLCNAPSSSPGTRDAAPDL